MFQISENKNSTLNVRVREPLQHGGVLPKSDADTDAKLVRIENNTLLDLSTGISPWVWPVPTLPQHVWQRLPDDDDDLETIAAQYYSCNLEQILAVPGSQWSIQKIPELCGAGAKVALPLSGYQEHWQAWHCAGHDVVFYHDVSDLLILLNANTDLSFAVVINPNNPTAEVCLVENLKKVEGIIEQRRGLLVVDEAFMDSTPEHSFVSETNFEHSVVLRSVGKFFGLAGVRLGFAIVHPNMKRYLAGSIRPWGVNGIARYVGGLCLNDRRWYELQCERLQFTSKELLAILSRLDFSISSSNYFVSLKGQQRAVVDFHQFLLAENILSRIFTAPKSESWQCAAQAANISTAEGRLRLGLPDEIGLARLKKAVLKYLGVNE